MDQYREALRQTETSGMGLDETDATTFKEHITKDVCKYFYVLEPVLKDRPNMKPAWTNHMQETQKNCDDSIELDDDESLATNTSDSNESDCVVMKSVKPSNMVYASKSRVSCNIQNSNYESSNTSSLSTERNSSSNATNVGNKSSKRRTVRNEEDTSCSAVSTSISPVGAKTIQRNLYKDKKKQICTATKKNE
jgi:hypothetical protein